MGALLVISLLSFVLGVLGYRIRLVQKLWLLCSSVPSSRKTFFPVLTLSVNLCTFDKLDVPCAPVFGLFADYRKWEIAIEDWQQPILKDEKLPEWYVFSNISGSG